MPILPGKTESWKERSKQLTGPRREEFLGHIHRLGLTRQEWWIQSGPQGDVLVVANEGDEPDKMLAKFAQSDHPFDDEWAHFILEHLGVDVKNPPPGPLGEHVGLWASGATFEGM
jgi:hypothetical protein